MTSPKDYILGTHDEEIERLGLQHAAWRSNALAVWRSAGIAPGQTVLDVGCGPGFASADLAEMVGARGRIAAIDKSPRFLAALLRMRLENIGAYPADLEAGEFPAITADAAWCRWVLAFTRNPREILARVAAALRPRGVVVLHEYFDYGTWRSSPRCPELEQFVTAVMASWRDNGGEPEIGLSLPGWLAELGFELRRVRPIIEAVQPADLKWAWLRRFIEVNRRRLVELGYLTANDAEDIWRAFTALEAAGAWMITPGVLEIVGRVASR